MARGKRPPVMGMALLIGGAAVGAGILGLPVQTGLAGLLPSVLGQVLLAVALWVTAWIIAEGLIRRDAGNRDLAWLFEQELGPWGRWLTIAGYLVNYYGALVAYLAGAGAVLSTLLGWEGGRAGLTVAFFIPATALGLFGLAVVRRGNAVFMALLGLSLAYLLWRGLQGMQPARLAHTDWGFAPSILPIIMCSLAFHNMVPVTCRSLGYQRGPVRLALVLGMLIPLSLGLLWTLVVVGALPLSGGEGSLLGAFQADQPATLPLAAALHSPGIKVAGMVFSLCAILTSYLAVVVALMGFWRDLWPAAGRWTRAALTFLPPILVVEIYPDLFLQALDMAGGLGVALVFGVAPALMLLRWRSSSSSSSPPAAWVRLGGWLLLALFLAVACLELAQEAGWLHLRPEVEHWTSYQPR